MNPESSPILKRGTVPGKGRTGRRLRSRPEEPLPRRASGCHNRSMHGQWAGDLPATSDRRASRRRARASSAADPSSNARNDTMRPFGAWFGRLAMAGTCLLGAGCGGGGDIPDPDSDSHAAGGRRQEGPRAPRGRPRARAGQARRHRPRQQYPGPRTREARRDRPEARRGREGRPGNQGGLVRHRRDAQDAGQCHAAPGRHLASPCRTAHTRSKRIVRRWCHPAARQDPHPGRRELERGRRRDPAARQDPHPGAQARAGAEARPRRPPTVEAWRPRDQRPRPIPTRPARIDAAGPGASPTRR